jgi:C-terminal processing protease CtpA/Prc
MKGVVDSLGDPHSEFLDPIESEEFLDSLEGELTGIGEDRFYVSDNEDKFMSIASKILDMEINKLIKVNLGEGWFLN